MGAGAQRLDRGVEPGALGVRVQQRIGTDQQRDGPLVVALRGAIKRIVDNRQVVVGGIGGASRLELVRDLQVYSGWLPVVDRGRTPAGDWSSHSGNVIDERTRSRYISRSTARRQSQVSPPNP